MIGYSRTVDSEGVVLRRSKGTVVSLHSCRCLCTLALQQASVAKGKDRLEISVVHGS